jgi:hypothetical protein
MMILMSRRTAFAGKVLWKVKISFGRDAGGAPAWPGAGWRERFSRLLKSKHFSARYA